MEENGGAVCDRIDLTGSNQAVSLAFALGFDGVTELLNGDAVTIEGELGHRVLSISIVGGRTPPPPQRTRSGAHSPLASPAFGVDVALFAAFGVHFAGVVQHRQGLGFGQSGKALHFLGERFVCDLRMLSRGDGRQFAQFPVQPTCSARGESDRFGGRHRLRLREKAFGNLGQAAIVVVVLDPDHRQVVKVASQPELRARPLKRLRLGARPFGDGIARVELARRGADEFLNPAPVAVEGDGEFAEQALVTLGDKPARPSRT